MMVFKLHFADRAKIDLRALEANKTHQKRLKAFRNALGRLQSNPRHPGLKTYKYSSLSGPDGEEIFEAYAENNTPAAYRIFWFYGPEKKITIVAITPHP
jgi:hypothetical protein